jgi:hypothetical protein
MPFQLNNGESWKSLEEQARKSLGYHRWRIPGDSGEHSEDEKKWQACLQLLSDYLRGCDQNFGDQHSKDDSGRVFDGNKG